MRSVGLSAPIADQAQSAAEKGLFAFWIVRARQLMGHQTPPGAYSGPHPQNRARKLPGLPHGPMLVKAGRYTTSPHKGAHAPPKRKPKRKPA